LHLVSGDLWAGAEVILYTLSKALHKKPDIKVSVVILNTGKLEEKLRELGISVYVLDESQLNSLQIFRRLCSILNQIQPDVLHSHRLKENIIGSIAAWYKHIPSIRTVHGAPEHRSPFWKLAKNIILLLNWLGGRFLQHSIVAVSADLAGQLKNHYPENKIRVIENGIDINALIVSTQLTSKKDNTVHHIGIAGRLTPVKRVDIFIDCAVYLKKHHPELNLQFHIFGSGPLQEILTKQVDSNQANNYIHFEGHTENIPQRLQLLDALLMTSDHEGLPMILLEAMCLKTPIIAHAVGGIPQLLNHGKCGILVSDHSAKGYAEATLNLITQDNTDIIDQAYRRVNKHYSVQQTAEKYETEYHLLK